MDENQFYLQYQREIKHFVKQAIKEDFGKGDHSSLSCLNNHLQSEVEIIAKEPAKIAGIKLAQIIFNTVNPSIKCKPMIKDGDYVLEGGTILVIKGPQQDLLAIERLVLNCLQRMSGIATLTAQLNKKIKHTNCQLLDTRKTTPNFRYPEKWAVKIGGGKNHRMGLFDVIMIKDNHIDFNGSITKTVKKTKQYLIQHNLALKTIVETRNIKEIKQCFQFPWIHRILLDNMSPEELCKAVQLINGKYLTEASGNIREDNLVAVEETGVDFASIGALTHSANIIDLSLKMV